MDLKMSLVYAGVMWVMEVIFKDIGYRLIEPVFPVLKDADLRELKLQKAALSFFKVWFYGGLFIWGFITLKDDPSFFWLVGGSGHMDNSVRDYPYLVRSNPDLESYMLASTGYYIKVTIQHMFGPRRNDYVELALHHFLAFYLLTWCFLSNNWEHGVIIVWLHYANDALVAFFRIMVDLIKPIGIAAYVANILVWIYLRLIAFPYVIYKMWTAGGAFGDSTNRYVCVLLSCLVMLHIHWVILLINILLKFNKDGSTEDTVNKIETRKAEVKQ